MSTFEGSIYADCTFHRILEDSRTRRRETGDDLTGSTTIALQFIDKKDVRGLTALQIALLHKNENIALILIECGANIHVKLVCSSVYSETSPQKKTNLPTYGTSQQ